MRLHWLYTLLFGFLLSICEAIAKFEPVSITDTSLVIKMIKAENVSSFDMIVFIYNLERLVEFRKTELRGSQRDQLFSFDGLLPSTWFVFRIHYRIQLNNGQKNLDTKQELIVKTKSSPKENPNLVNDTIISIEETFLGLSDVYISVRTIFADSKKIGTVVVPEMKCGQGVIKPLAQPVHQNVKLHFDLKPVHLKTKDCTEICIFPFLRVQIINGTSETFRGKEWCGTVQEANKLGASETTKNSVIPTIFILLLVLNY